MKKLQLLAVWLGIFGFILLMILINIGHAQEKFKKPIENYTCQSPIDPYEFQDETQWKIVASNITSADENSDLKFLRGLLIPYDIKKWGNILATVILDYNEYFNHGPYFVYAFGWTTADEKTVAYVWDEDKFGYFEIIDYKRGDIV